MKTDIRRAWFSIADAVELAGVKSTTLEGWLDRQLVLPAGRTGPARIFSTLKKLSNDEQPAGEKQWLR